MLKEELLTTLIANAIKSGIEGSTTKCRVNAEKLLVRLKEKNLTFFAKEIENVLRGENNHE